MTDIFKNKDKNLIELLKGSSISLILKVSAMMFGYVNMLFITNVHGAEAWGLFSLCFTILSISILLPKFGFDNSLVRILTELNTFKNKNEIKKVFFKSLSISLSISLVIILLLNTFSDFLTEYIFKNEEVKPYIFIISLTIVPTVLIVLMSATFQAFKKMVLFMLFQTVLINFVFLLFLVLYELQGIEVKIFKLYLYATLVTLVLGSFFFIKSYKNLQADNTLQKNIYGYRSIISISTPMLLSSSFALLMGWSDIIMLAYYKTTTDVGIYSSALKLAALSGVTLIAVNAIATPKFVEFHSKQDIKGLKDTVQKSTKMIFLTATPILIVLVVFSKEVLGIFGNEFIIGYLALIYLCISRFINAISGSVGFIMQMTDLQKTYQNVIIIAFFINLILNFILIPEYGFNGAAIASSCAMVFWNITLVIIIKRKLGFWTIYIPFLFK